MAQINITNTLGENLQKIIEELPQEVLKALEKSGQIVENQCKKNSRVDTGTLRASHTHKVDESDYSCSVGTPVEYAQYEEDKIAYFSRAFAEQQDNVLRQFEGLLERSVN